MHNENKVPLIRLAKRDMMEPWKVWCIRLASIVLALLLGGLGVPRHIAGAGRRQRRKHFAHEHLGLGPGDEHAGAHLHRNVTKGHFPRDVLQGLPGPAPPHIVAQHPTLVLRERPIEIDEQLRTRKPAGFREQPLRREPRVLVPLVGQVPLSPFQRFLYRPFRHQVIGLSVVKKSGADRRWRHHAHIKK